MAKMFYASVASDGEIRHVGNFKETVASALDDYGPNFFVEHVKSGARSNPYKGGMNIEKIVRSTGLLMQNNGKKFTRRQVMKMSLREAWERVHPFNYSMVWFEKKRKIWHHGYDSPTYQSPRLLANSLLTQNSKLIKHKIPASRRKKVEVQMRAKQLRIYKETPDSSVYGLTLLPHSLLEQMPKDLRYGEAFTDLVPIIKETDFPRGKSGKSIYTWCAGSNSQCRDSCLTYSGKNWMQERNAKIKVAKALALFHEPAAFLRLLRHSIEHFMNSRTKSGEMLKKYCRLNVLSDIPWEAICPWLFKDFQGEPISFYDYTKCSGRTTPRNYDITFSFSGDNEVQTIREMERGRRVAVVFLGERKRTFVRKEPIWEKIHSGQHAPLPRKFKLPGQDKWYPVWDGDAYDMRPLDPKRVFMGLRWKTPLGQAVDPQASDFNFVTPCFVISDTEASLDRSNPRMGRKEWLVAPVTPRYTPFEYEDLDQIARTAQKELYGVVPVDIQGELGL